MGHKLFAGAVHRQDAAVVGQRVQHHGHVLARLDHLIEVAYGAFAHRAGQGAIDPDRFTALQSGQVDILSRNSTWTFTRDAELGLTFGPVTFYDGQAIMTRTEIVSDPAAGLEALEGANVCVQSGTTTELNLADQFRAAGVNYEPVVFEDQNAAFQAIVPNNMRAKITATFLFMFTIGSALGPNLVSSITTYVFGDPDQLRYSLALTHAVLGPLAVFVFWKGLRAYGEAFARARASGG